MNRETKIGPLLTLAFSGLAALLSFSATRAAAAQDAAMSDMRERLGRIEAKLMGGGHYGR